MTEPERKRKWARENRKGKGEMASTFTHSDIMKARGYTLADQRRWEVLRDADNDQPYPG